MSRRPRAPTTRSGEALNRATVAAGFVAGLLSGARALGVDPGPLLDAAQLPRDCLQKSTTRVPIANYAALYNAVAATLQDEGFGLFPTPLRPGSFEFLCRSVLSSRTLDEAVGRCARFLGIVMPDLEIGIRRDGRQAFIEIAERRPLQARRDDPRRVFAFEWTLRLVHGLACWLAARGLTLEKVEFPFPAPDHAAEYARVYTEHSSFDAERLVATLDAQLLDLPVRRGEADLDAFLEGAPGRISMLYRRDREMARAVREWLMASLPRTPNLAETARHLHLSERTLHRRLREEGTSFRALRDAVRRELAFENLAKSGRSVAVTAEVLGYSEPSAFFRAFQKWTGEAPSRWRRRLAHT